MRERKCQSGHQNRQQRCSRDRAIEERVAFSFKSKCREVDELKSTGMGIRQERRRGGSKRSVGAKEMGNQLVSTLRQETWQGGSVGRKYGRRYEGGWGRPERSCTNCLVATHKPAIIERCPSE